MSGSDVRSFLEELLHAYRVRRLERERMLDQKKGAFPHVKLGGPCTSLGQVMKEGNF